MCCILHIQVNIFHGSCSELIMACYNQESNYGRGLKPPLASRPQSQNLVSCKDQDSGEDRSGREESRDSLNKISAKVAT